MGNPKPPAPPAPGGRGVHVMRYRTAYAETDQMGRIYYGHFVTWLERARTELLRDLGIRYRDLESTGLFLPVRSLEIRYRRAPRYDEILTFATVVDSTRRASVAFVTAFYAEDGELLATGCVEVAAIDRNGAPARIPDPIRRRLAEAASLSG